VQKIPPYDIISFAVTIYHYGAIIVCNNKKIVVFKPSVQIKEAILHLQDSPSIKLFVEFLFYFLCDFLS
jgi:hypothetical protein